MAVKGKISDLFELPVLERQQKEAIKLVDRFLKKVAEANKNKIQLQQAGNPSQILSAIDKIQKEQRDLNALIAQGIAKQKEFKKTVDDYTAAQKKSTSATRENTKASKENATTLDGIQKTKKKIAEAQTYEAQQQAMYDQQLKETNRDLRINAEIENAVTKSIGEANAQVKKLTAERDTLNLATENGTKRLKEINAELKLHKDFIEQAKKATAQSATEQTDPVVDVVDTVSEKAIEAKKAQEQASIDHAKSLEEETKRQEELNAAMESAAATGNQPTKLIKDNDEVKEAAKAVIVYRDELERLTGTIDENKRLQVIYQTELDDVNRKLRVLKTTTDESKKGSKAYQDEVAALTGRQAELKRESSDLAKTLQLQVKEQNAAAGSIEKMEARFELLNQQLEKSGDAFKKTEVGKALIKETQDLSVAIDKAKAEFDGYTDVVKNSITEANEKIKEHKKELESIDTTTEQGRKRAAELSKEIQKQNDIIKQAKAHDSAYKRLALAFDVAAREAKDLAAQYGVMDKRAQEAAKRANQLNNELKKIDASVGNFQRNVGNYPKALDRVGSSVLNLGRNFLSLIGIVGAGSLFKASIDEFIEMDKNVRLLQNTLKNLGVPEAFDRITASADRLAKQFTFLDNDEILKTFNQLIVYGKLTEDQINQLIPVIIDFASASGKDLNEATSLVIKALEGNGRALKEYGINMKNAKSATDGVNIIMKELKPRVEGVAAAFKESAAGGLASANQEFKDMKEEIGQGLLPVLNTLLGFLLDVGTGAKLLYNDIKDLFTLKRIGSTNDLNSTLEDANASVEKTMKSIEGLKPEEKIAEIDHTIASINQAIKLAKDFQKLEVDETGVFKGQVTVGMFKTEEERDADVAYQKERLRLLQAQKKVLTTPVDPKKILGVGDPGDEGAKKQLEDFEKEVVKVNDDIRKVNFETAKRRIQDEIDASQEIIDNDQKTYDERYAATQKFYDKSKELLDKQLAFDLESSQLETDEEKRQTELKLRKGDLTVKQRKDLNDKLKSLDELGLRERELLVANYNSAIIKLDTNSEKQRTGVLASEIDQRIRLLEDQQAKRQKLEDRQGEEFDIDLSGIQNQYDQELNLLESSFREKTITEKEYNRQKLQLQLNLQKDLLIREIEFTDQQIQNARAKLEEDKAILAERIKMFELEAGLFPTEDNQKKVQDAKDALVDLEIDGNLKIQASEKELAALQIKLAGLVGDFVKESNEQNLQNYIETFEKIADVAKQTFELIGQLLNVSVVRQKNAIQDQIDLLERQKQKDIEVADQTIANAQDKAAEIARIEAIAAGKRQQLELQQRRLDEKKARYEKAQAISSIIINTALAVVKFLAQANIPGAILAGALGAAQLAIAIATPVARYAEGIGEQPSATPEVSKTKKEEGHPGGDAIIGERKDKKPELVEEPGKEPYVIDKPTLVKNLPKGSRVVPLTTENKRLLKAEEQKKKVAVKELKKDIAAYRNGVGQQPVAENISNKWMISTTEQANNKTISNTSSDNSISNSYVSDSTINKPIDIKKSTETNIQSSKTQNDVKGDDILTQSYIKTNTDIKTEGNSVKNNFEKLFESIQNSTFYNEDKFRFKTFFPDLDKIMVSASLNHIPDFKESKITVNEKGNPETIAVLKTINETIKKIPQPQITVENVLRRGIRSKGGDTIIR